MLDRGSFRAPDPMLAMPVLSLEVTRILEDLARFDMSWERLKRTQPEYLKRLRRIATVESVAASTSIEDAEVTNVDVSNLIVSPPQQPNL